MMNTKDITLSIPRLMNQGKSAYLFVEFVDFGKFIMSNYGKYLGINRIGKMVYPVFCQKRIAKPGTCKSAGSLNTQEWSS